MHSSWLYSITSISGYVVESQKLVRNGKELDVRNAQKLVRACRESGELLSLIGERPIELILAIIGIILDDTAQFASHDAPTKRVKSRVRDMESGAVLNVSRGKGSDALRGFAARLKRQNPRWRRCAQRRQ